MSPLPSFCQAYKEDDTLTKVRDFLGPYRLARLIRVGSSCSVWEAIKQGETERYALKVLRNDQVGNKQEEGYLKHEFNISRPFRHPKRDQDLRVEE